MLKDIPVNIVTGFLGVGKTSAIQQLLKHKPRAEKWAILINEFGQIGIDQTALPAEQNVTIKELPGGCLCCTMGLPLTMSLVMLLQRTKPDRLIIEPTGLGHPAGIIDILRSETFASALTIQSTICLVDPRSLNDEKTRNSSTYRDQISLADIVLINKTDLAPPELTDELEHQVKAMYPPKRYVQRTQQGQFDLSLLDSKQIDRSSPTSDLTHPAIKPHPHPQGANQPPVGSIDHPQPGSPLQQSAQGLGHYSCGWRFHPDDNFELEKLNRWFDSHAHFERIKGVFRCADQWLLINQIGSERSISPIAWRQDSRLEIIHHLPVEQSLLESALLQCIATK